MRCGFLPQSVDEQDRKSYKALSTNRAGSFMKTPIRIAVGVLTRERPVMFETVATCLESQLAPDGAELLYVVCENGPSDPRVKSRIAAMGERTGRQTEYVHEGRLGIPFARNAVLERALAVGATHVAFIDDDETADPDWIAQLFAGLVKSGAGLVGGPVICSVDPDLRLGFWQRRVAAGMISDRVRRNEKFRKFVAQGKGGKICLATNNWLCDLAVLQRIGLRFREEIGLGSGSDTAFWHDFKALGGSSSWVPDAVVRETLPIGRLRPGYVVARGKSHAAAEWERRVKANTRAGRLRAMVFILKHGIAGAIGAGVGVLFSPYVLYRGLYAMGRALGRSSALLSGRSGVRLYEKVQGN